MSFNILGYFLGIDYASIYGILIVGFIKGEVGGGVIAVVKDEARLDHVGEVVLDHVFHWFLS